MTELETVKAFWETNTPQYWYSKHPIATREYYDELRNVRYTRAYPYLPAKAEFNLHHGERVLEVGCGQGTDLLQFALNGAEVTGVDLTEGAIAKSRAHFDAYGVSATLLTANAQNLKEFADETFDVVYSFGVLHHTPDTEQAVAEVHRVLRKGGKAIVMLYASGPSHTLGIWYWQYVRLECLKMTAMETVAKHAEYVDGCPLAKYYSKEMARQLFSAFAHVDVERLLCYHYLPEDSVATLGRRLRYKVYALLNKFQTTQQIFGHNIFIKAIK